MRGSARKYDVRMAQFVLKIEKLSHILGPRASQDLRSPSPIMAPGNTANISMAVVFLQRLRLEQTNVLQFIKCILIATKMFVSVE